MIYRTLRRISTGQWLNTLFTFEKDDPQNTSAATHAEQIAAGWGIAPADLEVLDSPMDMRSGILIQGPVPLASTPDPDLADIRAAVPAWSTLTSAQKVEVVRSALRVIIKDKAGIP